MATTERGESNAVKDDRPSSDITTGTATAATGRQETVDEVLNIYPLVPADNDEKDPIFVSDAVCQMLLYPVVYKVIKAIEEFNSTLHHH